MEEKPKKELAKLTCIGLRLYDEGRNNIFLCRKKGADTWNLPSLFIPGSQVNLSNPIAYVNEIAEKFGITPMSAIGIIVERSEGTKKSTGEPVIYTLIVYEVKYKSLITSKEFIIKQKYFGDCIWEPTKSFKKRDPENLTLVAKTLQRVMKSGDSIA